MPGRRNRGTKPWTLKPASGIPARGTTEPFEPGNLANLRSGAESERKIAELMPETQAEVAEALSGIRKQGEEVAPADNLLGHRMARNMAKLKLYDRYEDAVLAAFQSRVAELQDEGPEAIEAAYREVLTKLDTHADRKGRAELLFLKQLWAAGLGEMAQARVAEARSAADARNPQPRGREAQEKALRIVNGEVVPKEDGSDAG